MTVHRACFRECSFCGKLAHINSRHSTHPSAIASAAKGSRDPKSTFDCGVSPHAISSKTRLNSRLLHELTGQILGQGGRSRSRSWMPRGCTTDQRRIPFPITRYLEDTAFPITRLAYRSRGLSLARFGVRRSNPNRNTNLATPLPSRSTPFRVTHRTLAPPSCYQVAPVVLLESKRRAIGDRTACYQILSTGCESPDFRDYLASGAPLTL
jgi:hypothetical protein